MRPSSDYCPSAGRGGQPHRPPRWLVAELHKRHWQYHKALQKWFTLEQGAYMFFDTDTWDKRGPSRPPVSTRILGRRTAPCPPFRISDRVPHGLIPIS